MSEPRFLYEKGNFDLTSLPMSVSGPTLIVYSVTLEFVTRHVSWQRLSVFRSGSFWPTLQQKPRTWFGTLTDFRNIYLPRVHKFPLVTVPLVFANTSPSLPRWGSVDNPNVLVQSPLSKGFPMESNGSSSPVSSVPFPFNMDLRVALERLVQFSCRVWRLYRPSRTVLVGQHLLFT